MKLRIYDPWRECKIEVDPAECVWNISSSGCGRIGGTIKFSKVKGAFVQGKQREETKITRNYLQGRVPVEDCHLNLI